MFNGAFLEHVQCMPQANMALRSYAEQNGGRYPFHHGGYPQALLLLPQDTPWYAFTGPGYDGEVLAQGKRNRETLRED
jgi:hypothetical protein